jgi:CRISPR-associated protein Cas6
MHPMVEMCFPLKGSTLPVDHGFALYSATSRVCNHLHNSDNAGIALVRGKYAGNGLIEMNRLSCLKLRIPVSTIQNYLDLSGKSLSIDGHRITLDSPSIVQLKPRSALYAHIVTTRNGNDEERFKSALRDQLSVLGVQAVFTVGRRKTFKIHDKQIVGYSLLVTGLTAEESIILQEAGLGGRRKMGCGIFVGIR